MKIRHFPAAVIATATLALWISATESVVAQDASSANENIPGAPTSERVQLPGGAEGVLKLTRAKVNDDVTVAFIQSSGRRITLTASEIIYLRKEGVSDRVLTAMLSQESTAAPATTATPAPAPAPEASAPQYVAQPATTVLETAPASTVYLATTPTYYSFYDPWPYWSGWYAYPFLSFGFCWGWGNWGSCNYAYWNNCGWNNWNNCNWNTYCRNGFYPSTVNGNRPLSPNGNPATRGSMGTGTRPERLVAEARQPSSTTQAPAGGAGSRTENRSTGSTSSPRPTSNWSDNRNQTSGARPSPGQASGVASRSDQSTAPTSLAARGATTRTAAAGTVENRGNAQFVGSRRASSSTTVWSGSANQRPTAPTVRSQNATVVGRATRTANAPVVSYNRQNGPSAPRYQANPGANYQRASVNPGYGYRGGGSLGSVNRPSMSPSYGRMGSSSGFRGGGSFSGGGASHMSSGGGGFHGGGGGGRSR